MADRDGQPYRETDTRTSGTLVPTCARARERLGVGGWRLGVGEAEVDGAGI